MTRYFKKYLSLSLLFPVPVYTRGKIKGFTTRETKEIIQTLTYTQDKQYRQRRTEQTVLHFLHSNCIHINKETFCCLQLVFFSDLILAGTQSHLLDLFYLIHRTQWFKSKEIKGADIESPIQIITHFHMTSFILIRFLKDHSIPCALKKILVFKDAIGDYLF